jgi:hypothetical protein
MHAEVGDEIVVEGGHVGDIRREGMVLEVLGEPGHEHYLVRWDDNGHETIFYPGPDARIVHLGPKK